MKMAGVATRSLWNRSGSQSVLKRLAELRRLRGGAGGEGGGRGVFGGGKLSGPHTFPKGYNMCAGLLRLDAYNCHVSNQQKKSQDQALARSSVRGFANKSQQRGSRWGSWTDGDNDEEEEGKEVVMTRARRGQSNPRTDGNNKDSNDDNKDEGSRNRGANKWWEEGEEREEEGGSWGWDRSLESSPWPPSREGAVKRSARGGEGRGYGRGYGDDMKDRTLRGKRGGDGGWEREGGSMRGASRSRGGGGSEREQARWRGRDEEEEEEWREREEGTWGRGREQRGSGRERGFSARRAGPTVRSRSGGSVSWEGGWSGGRFGVNSRKAAGYGRDEGGQGYGREEGEEGEGRERSTTMKRRIVGEIIYGVSPVIAALGALRREIYGLYVQEGLESKRKKDRRGVDMVMKRAEELQLTTETVSKHELNLLCDNRPHQGLVLDASPLQFVDVKEIPPPEEDQDWEHLPDGRVVPPCWVALDEVMDPQNFGAVLRSAYFLGATGVVTCARNSSPLSAVVSKASSGAMEAMQVYSCKNMFKFLSQCRANGWRVLGASSSPTAVACRDLARAVPTIFVLGNEGVGLRENVRRECTEMVRIPGSAKADLGGHPFVIDSLNVSVAAGILLHELLIPCERVAGTGLGGERHPGGLSALDWSDSSTSQPQEHQPKQHEDGRQATLAASEETEYPSMEELESPSMESVRVLTEKL